MGRRWKHNHLTTCLKDHVCFNSFSLCDPNCLPVNNKRSPGNLHAIMYTVELEVNENH